MRAPEPHDQSALHLQRDQRAGLAAVEQPRVRRVEELASPVQLPDPPHEQHLALVLLVDDGLPAAGDLEEEDAEAVDVGPGGGQAGHGALGGLCSPWCRRPWWCARRGCG